MYTVILLLSLFARIRCHSTVTSLHDKDLNNSLIISSFRFNNNSIIPTWVPKTFGNEAVYFDKSSWAKLDSSTPIDKDELLTANEKILNQTQIANVQPLCSIEMVGFINIESEHAPFSRKLRHNTLILNRTNLVTQDEKMSIPCEYRVLLENWRPESNNVRPSFWTIVYYCPMKDSASCDRLNQFSQEAKEVPFKISLSGHNPSHVFQHEFKAQFHSPTTQAFHASTKPGADAGLNLGICVAIPYSSSDADKHRANGVMLQEWIKYYVKLGIKVFIYDRDGANEEYVRAVQQTQSEDSSRYINYYNYTIRGLLDPVRKGFKYDNTEIQTFDGNHLRDGLIRSSRTEMQATDKVNTLTHCRFEAKATHGVENMIVADFDEFLYCPAAPISAAGQYNHIAGLVQESMKKAMGQLSFYQLVVANTTISTRDCVIERVNSGETIHMCFAPSKYIGALHSVKTIALGHRCPITGYHQSCGTDDLPRAFDCTCPTASYVNKPKNCHFIHYSTNKHAFISYKRRQDMDSRTGGSHEKYTK